MLNLFMVIICYCSGSVVSDVVNSSNYLGFELVSFV